MGFMPVAVCMGPCHVIACNERTVYSWLFSSGNQNLNQNQRDDDEDNGKLIIISSLLLFLHENTVFLHGFVPLKI